MKSPNNNFYNKKLKGLARGLRNDSTPAEIKLWNEVLKNRQLRNYQFLRQRPVLNYIADFMCKELKLIIEVDGCSHNDNWEYDRKKQKNLEEKGFTVIRFHDEEVLRDIENVIRTLEGWIENSGHPPRPLRNRTKAISQGGTTLLKQTNTINKFHHLDTSKNTINGGNTSPLSRAKRASEGGQGDDKNYK